MNFKEYRSKRVKEIEAETDQPATYADEILIEEEWEKLKEWEEEQSEKDKG
ncbi:MAG: hypothetical protein K9L66_05000 [Spirochaetaceae bacterium]|nr:hypothetical protein [Spirochaetaceae bacterium]MCF7948532.1 hypothetical protein [Spirochaetia bacterium]MCF7951010.1 hypothetical protein [Spirochaetaceae bacterium]